MFGSIGCAPAAASTDTVTAGARRDSRTSRRRRGPTGPGFREWVRGSDIRGRVFIGVVLAVSAGTGARRAVRVWVIERARVVRPFRTLVVRCRRGKTNARFGHKT